MTLGYCGFVVNTFSLSQKIFKAKSLGLWADPGYRGLIYNHPSNTPGHCGFVALYFLSISENFIHLYFRASGLALGTEAKDTNTVL